MDFQTLNRLFQSSREFNHKRIHRAGITNTECLICTFAFYHANCSQDDVSRGLKIDKTTVAKAMLTLEGKGLLTRNQDETDRRRKSLSLTPKGEEMCRKLGSLHDQWFENVLSVLSEEERAEFSRLCGKLLDKAESMSAEKH